MMTSHDGQQVHGDAIRAEGDSLFDRVASILEQARRNVVRAVNANMVLAYWLIGREIVEALQSVESRAEYGKQVIEDLSARLKNQFGRGFSASNLRYFRTFYLAYADRLPEIRQIGSGELGHDAIRQTQSGILADMTEAVETESCNSISKSIQHQKRHGLPRSLRSLAMTSPISPSLREARLCVESRLCVEARLCVGVFDERVGLSASNPASSITALNWK